MTASVPVLRSWLAWTLATAYTIVAVFVIQWEIRNTGGGFINLRALGTNTVTSPSQLVLGPVFRALGFRRIDIDNPGPSGYAQLAVHVVATAALVYIIGWGVDWLVRRVVSSTLSPS